MTTPRQLARLITIATIALPTIAAAQSSEFELTETGEWTQTEAPEPGTDAAFMAEMTKLIAEGNPGSASDKLGSWLERNKRTRNPSIPQGYYLHALARYENDREYKALFSLESIIQDFPDSPYFLRAVELEYKIGLDYINGKKRRFLGMRIENARPTGEELIIRTQERVPGSELAEQAAMTLADHYYKRRELKLAADMYSIFRQNYPNSPRVQRAMLREIEANIARFKGPRYDGSGLLDAKLLIEEYQRQFPADAIRSGITEGLDAWIDESAAQQVLDTARWYLRVDDDASARFVLARLIRRHPATDAADEALDIMLDRGWVTFEPAPSQTDETEPEPETEREADSATPEEGPST
jgi:outer membrane protein assembly factor BamD (BamD/ComL family)